MHSTGSCLNTRAPPPPVRVQRSPEPQRPRVWLLRAEKTTVVTVGEKTRATMLAAGTTAGGDLCMRYDGFYIHMTVYNIVYNYYPNES
jgi:hypothetical protein